MKFFELRRKDGFTLVELLVVIAIIGLFSSIALASLNSARSKARDSRRVSDVKEMQKALELYYADKGYYPNPSHGADVVHGIGFDTTCGGTPGCGHCNRWCTLDTLLSPYISKAPRDPLGTTQQNYYYSYSSNAPNDQLYGLSAILENPNSLAQNDGGFYNNAYEVGSQPSYCKGRYNADWLWRNATAGNWGLVCDAPNGN